MLAVLDAFLFDRIETGEKHERKDPDEIGPALGPSARFPLSGPVTIKYSVD